MSADAIPVGQCGDHEWGATTATDRAGTTPAGRGITLPSAILTSGVACPVNVVRPMGRSTLTGQATPTSLSPVSLMPSV